MKDNVFLAFAQLGEQIAETFNTKQSMRDFIAWLQNLTEELKKPREEQEGFARAITETIHGLKATIDGVAKAWQGDQSRGQISGRGSKRCGDSGVPNSTSL